MTHLGEALAAVGLDAEAAAIEAVELTKRYGDVVAVDHLSFRVRERAITGFLGPNGAGKTTTLRMVLGLARPTSGYATVYRRPYRKLEDPPRTAGSQPRDLGRARGALGLQPPAFFGGHGGPPESRVEEVLRLAASPPRVARC